MAGRVYLSQPLAYTEGMTVKPRDPQSMDPIDNPEEFIAASIWYHPLIFPTRTQVLEHTLLVNGNGYEWGEDGMLHSVFAHIEPDPEEASLEKYLRDAERWEAKEREVPDWPAEHSMARHYRAEYARLKAIQADYLHRARTYGPVRLDEQYDPNDGRKRRARTIEADYIRQWTLLGRAPENVHPVWQPYLEETRILFAPLFTEQLTFF
jgi:hypothetical protein